MSCVRRVVGATRSLVNATSLKPECVRELHGRLPVPVLIYISETMV